MHVGFDGVFGDFLRRLEERADIDVEAEIGEGGGDDLGAAVVAVLAHLGDEDARPPALLARKGFDIAADGGEPIIALPGAAINAGHGSYLRLVTPEHRL